MSDAGDSYAAQGYTASTKSHKTNYPTCYPNHPARTPAHYLDAGGGNNTACGATFLTGGVAFR